MNDRLYRSRTDRSLAGVAGGVAEHFDLDPSLVRVAWLILAFVSGGIFVLIYIVMAIVVPEEPIGVPGAWPAPGWAPPAAPPPPAPTPDPAGPGPAPAGAADPLTGTSAGPAAGAGFGAPVVGGWTSYDPGQPGSPGSYSPRDARRAAREARRAARWSTYRDGSSGPGAGGIVAGLILVTLGTYFLVRTMIPQLDLDRFWPVALIVLGVILVAGSIRRTPGGSTP